MPGFLKTKDIKIGEGAEARAGAWVKVHYTGRLGDGSIFDSSRGRDVFEFQLGAGQVIQGWDEGVAGMKAGGIRHLEIPPHKGYGKRGFPPIIPADATLFFEVELVAVG